MKKPLGIKLIIGLNLLGAIVTSIVGVIMILNFKSFAGSMYLLIAALVVFLVFLYLISVYGLWTLKRWGPVFTKWFYILGGLFSVYIIVNPMLGGNKIEVEDFFENLLGILICLSIAMYLSRKNIKELYKI